MPPTSPDRIAATQAAPPWRWIPTLYFAQGLPYVAVMTLSVVMYKNLGISNTEIALYTSWLYLPWVIKPLWSPLVELLGARRQWIVALQFAAGALLAGVALGLDGPRWWQLSLALLWLLAFASATHDIAADGFYLLALPPRSQAAFVGVRSAFYRLAMLAGQGGLVALAGVWMDAGHSAVQAWQGVMGVLAAAFVLVGLWHARALPRPGADGAVAALSAGPALAASSSGRTGLLRQSGAVFAAFFTQPGIARILAFLLLYRLGEAQLLKLVPPFLLDARGAGGLGLSNQALGLAYGTLGVAALTCGGLLGGWVISRIGLKRLLWPMMVAMHLPNGLFVWLAVAQPDASGWGLWLIGSAIIVEQFAYGFGFTAYMVYMLMVAGAGTHKTAHYALCTGCMALGMMLPGMAAGWLQQQLGYALFFTWACAAMLPSFVAAAWVRIDQDFGRREA